MELREPVHIVTDCKDDCVGDDHDHVDDHLGELFIWEHKVRCRCGAFVGVIGRLADRIDGQDVPEATLWEVRPAVGLVRIGPGNRSMATRSPEELRVLRRGGRCRRHAPKGVQWRCWRGCRLPSMSLRDIARAAESEYQRGRDVIHVG